MKRIGAKTKIKIIQAAQDGKSAAWIADQVGVSQAYVYQVANRVGIKFDRQKKAKGTYRDPGWLSRQIRAGVTAEQIAEKTCTRIETVKGYIRLYKITAPAKTEAGPIRVPIDVPVYSSVKKGLVYLAGAYNRIPSEVLEDALIEYMLKHKFNPFSMPADWDPKAIRQSRPVRPRVPRGEG